MRCALDATPLTVPLGGTARYVTELSLALARGFPEDEYFLLSDQPFEPPADRPENLKVSPLPVAPLDRRWWLAGLPRHLRRLGCDVFHGTDYSVPLLPLRASVLSLHDLSPWLDPAWHCGAQRVRRRTPWLLRLGSATLVLTLTEAVRRQAIGHFGLEPGKVRAVPLAAGWQFRAVEPYPHPRPYFLCVGTLEPRKNIPMAIEAWREVRRSHHVDLLIAGRRREDGPVIPDEQGLRWLGPVPDEELPALYSGALACLYPSFYEGFGLPVLEAMQCGAPVIASTDPAVTEVAGGAALDAAPRDTAAWVAAMTHLIEEPHARASLREYSLRRAAQFSWQRTAQATRAVYAEAIARHGG
jgi:glycosyltransferase involved in cell wall biosynthesis